MTTERNGPELRVRAARGGRSTTVIAASVRALRRFLLDPRASATNATRVRVVVRQWQAPHAGWVGRLGRLPGLRRHEIALPRGSRPGTARVTVDVTRPRDVSSIVNAVLSVLEPVPRRLGTLEPRVLHHTDSSPGELEYDLASGALEIEAVTVDPVLVNPRGRDASYRTQEAAEIPRLDIDATSWRVTAPGGKVLASGDLGSATLDDEQLAAGRALPSVCCELETAEDPVAAARIVVQLAAVGTPCSWPGLPDPVAALLGPELRALVRTPLPERRADPLHWEIRSVQQRRASLRGHSTGFAVKRSLAAIMPGIPELPSVSAIVVSRRGDFLRRAIAQVAAQSYPELEIIVGIHGESVDPAELEALRSACPRPLTIQSFPSSWRFGTVLAAATARASGSLVTKFDDDDLYGPEHIWDLVLAWHYSGATLVGKAAELTYLAPLDVTVRRVWSPAESYTDWVAGAALMIGRADLEAVGGWRPLPHAVDRWLISRVLEHGGLVYATHPLGFIVHRRSSGHTWDPTLDYYLRKSGQQWPGLLQHKEFGTAPADEMPAEAAQIKTC